MDEKTPPLVNVSYVATHPLRWLPEIWTLAHRRLQPHVKVMLLSALVGISAGLGAIVFYWACQVMGHYALAVLAGYEQPAPGGETPFFPPVTQSLVPWLLVVIPAVGGLISGVIIYSLAPEAEGHGTDAAIEAYHRRGGVIRFRVPMIKLVASALTLGTGGSGGREGPIAQIGAGVGSFLGRVLKLQPRERRVLMAAGMGAGIAAIFRAPLAGALFAAEVLYRSPDFESEVVIPAGLASVAAYCTFGLRYGWNPLFSIPPDFLNTLTFNNPWHLLAYSVLVPFLVVLAMIYTRSFYGLTAAFHHFPIRPHFKPMIGALLTGVVGVGLFYAFQSDAQVLSVLSFGYGILQQALTLDHMTLRFGLILLAISLGKILTTSLTIGSGGSGGVFGPSMVIGGCGGGALGIFLNHLWPWLVPHPAAFVVVGMAGFFSAAAKTPFSTLIIVSEMTGGYNLLLPTMWVCTLTFLLSDEQSIYRSQVESPAYSPAHQGDYIRAVLSDLSVKQFIKSTGDLTLLQAGDTLLTVIDHLASSSYSALPVIDSDGRLLGMVDLDDVHLASQNPALGTLVLATDLMRPRVIPLHAEDRLDRAVELFVENNLEALPVVEGVSSDRPTKHREKVIGMVRRSDVARSYIRRVHGAATGGEIA